MFAFCKFCDMDYDATSTPHTHTHCRSAIDTFIDDNKKLMRRMYGSLIQEEVEVVENVQGCHIRCSSQIRVLDSTRAQITQHCWVNPNPCRLSYWQF